MSEPTPHVVRIASESFANWLGTELVHGENDRVVVRLPYQEHLGKGRIHGGAITALIDVAATAAFWSSPLVTSNSRGATVALSVNFLKLAKETDLYANATVRRRGGTLCTGNVVVTDEDASEVAIAVVTYKLQH